MPGLRPRTAPRRNDVRFKNIAATLQRIERAQRLALKNGDGKSAPPAKLGPLQKIVAFGPLLDLEEVQLAGGP